LAKVLKQLGLASTALIVVGADRTGLERVARNLPGVKLIGPRELNVYDVLRYDSIVIPEREVPRIQEAWS
jgi:large subunit ribosomal protein L4